MLVPDPVPELPDHDPRGWLIMFWLKSVKEPPVRAGLPPRPEVGVPDDEG